MKTEAELSAKASEAERDKWLSSPEPGDTAIAYAIARAEHRAAQVCRGVIANVERSGDKIAGLNLRIGELTQSMRELEGRKDAVPAESGGRD